MHNRTSWFLGVAAMVLPTLAAAVDAEPRPNAVRDGRVEAELIAQDTGLIRGEQATIGLRLKMDDEWHTYWRNPGDSGMATTIEWHLPEGFIAGEINWTTPQYLSVGGLASYAYEGEILLPIKLTVPESYDADEVTLRATVDWLVCKEQCEPGTAELELAVPVVTAFEQNVYRQLGDISDLFIWADSRVPKKFMHPEIHAQVTANNVIIHLGPELKGFGFGLGQAVTFFPYSPRLIDMAAAQQVDYDPEKGYSLTLTKSTQFDPELIRADGVVVFNGNDWPLPYEIHARFRDVADDETK